MMGRKKAEGVQILLKECGLEEKVTVDQYNEIYDKRIDELMQNTKVREELANFTTFWNN
jgi:hypothetical protein